MPIVLICRTLGLIVKTVGKEVLILHNRKKPESEKMEIFIHLFYFKIEKGLFGLDIKVMLFEGSPLMNERDLPVGLL